MRTVLRLVVALALVAAGLIGGSVQASEDVALEEFRIDEKASCEIAQRWMDRMRAERPDGGWVALEAELSDADLRTLGLPPREVLTAQRYPSPTLVTADGRTYDVPLSSLEAKVQPQPSEPTVTTFAGAGCFGIRPGALYLVISNNSISLCSLAHLYGSSISTAGHCGKTGDTATVIAATGNRPDATGVVLLDFGRFGQSHDGGLGRDWALISIDPAYFGLVTPTMCFWGGPRGVYTKTGEVIDVNLTGNGNGNGRGNGGGSGVTVNPDPLLAQAIVHYGHGLGVGAGGTPRSGATITWGDDHFMFFGAIAPGDSGSGANTVLGDAVGANMQAAGIITHIWIDPLMREGVGIMGGTRATVVGTPTNGQYVPYPIPISGLP